MNIKRIGIDLAKNSFSLCAVDENDKIVLERNKQGQRAINSNIRVYVY